MVEFSLKKKLADFPTLTHKDPSKFVDLVDILLEIEAGHVARDQPHRDVSSGESSRSSRGSLHSTKSSISSGFRAKFATTLASPSTPLPTPSLHQHLKLSRDPHKQENRSLYGRPISVSLPSLPKRTHGVPFTIQDTSWQTAMRSYKNPFLKEGRF